MHNIYSIGMALEEEGFKIINNITWQKTNPPPNLACKTFTHSTETILWARKDLPKVKYKFNYDLMKELNDKINNLKEQIENIKENQYKDLFEAVSGILSDLSSKVEEISLRQDYLEENMEFMDNDLTDIQDELFEEVSFDDLSSIEDEYVEIKCENCDKPLFVEQQALNNNSSIPCPFCGKRAR